MRVRTETNVVRTDARIALLAFARLACACGANDFDQIAGSLASAGSDPADSSAAEPDSDILPDGFPTRPEGFLVVLSTPQAFGPDGSTYLDLGFELHLNFGISVDDPESDCGPRNPAPDWGGRPGDGVGGPFWSSNADGTQQIWMSQPPDEGPGVYIVEIVCRPETGCPLREIEITVFLDGVEILRNTTTRLIEHALWQGASLDWGSRRARRHDRIVTPPPGL
jgi:hypothetical protein